MGLGNIERKIRSDSAYQRKEAELLIEKLNPRLIVGPLLRENLIKIKLSYYNLMIVKILFYVSDKLQRNLQFK